ncbi:MAG: universal stress protein [Steroidobacteraceae bacterium]
MDRITDILVIANPLVREQPAISKAAKLAGWCGADIELLICDTRNLRQAHTEGGLPPLSNALLSDNLEALLEEFAQPLRDAGIGVETHIIGGDPLHKAVVSWMRNSPADLVVKDTHHHSFAKRALGVNTDWHLIRTCPAPLLLTKPAIWGSPPVLLAAVDPGHVNDKSGILDHRILDVTRALAKCSSAQVHAAHAYFPSTIAAAAVAGMPMAGVSANALSAELNQRISLIRALGDEFAIAAENLHVETAAAVEYLPRVAAQCHADIVVMGAISRSSLGGAFIGSTAERVLEALPCDALVVKPRDFARDLPF